MSAGALLTACGSSSASSITLYNGQHVQTTDALVSAFEKIDRDNREREEQRRGLLWLTRSSSRARTLPLT